MKKIFTYILITLILITPFFAAQQTAYAQEEGGVVDTVVDAVDTVVVTPGEAVEAAATAINDATKGAAAAAAQAAAGEIASWFKNMVSWIAYASLFQSAALAGVAGVLLEESIQFSVVTMSATIDAYPAINYGWSLVRDLGNFIFIFALLYVAFTTIFGMADGNTMKLIRNIIIVGLLVNFSLFFTKILIDASNILSLVFYSQFATAGASTGSGALDAAVDTITMTEKLAGFLKIQSFFNANTAQATLQNNDWIPLLTIGIGGTIFFLSTAFSFLYAALLFLLRFLMLIILLILSPIGFLGYMLPATSGLAQKWWNLLVAQLAFAPLYMLLISVVFLLAGGMDKIYPAGAGGLDGVLKTVSGANAANGAAGGAVAENGGYSKVIGPIVNFIVIIGLINAAAIISTVVATNTSGFAKGMKDRSRVWLGRTTFGTAGAVGRNTIGRVAYNKSQDRDLMDRAAYQTGVKGLWARGVLGATSSLAGKSFDARATNALKKAGLGDAGGKKGYAGAIKETETRIKGLAGKLKDGDIFRHADGTIITGGSLYNQAWKESSSEKDRIKRQKLANDLYKAKVSEQEKKGFTKVSRKEMFAERVQKGTLLQRISTLGSRSLYEASYAGHMAAADAILKEISNKKDKQKLPGLRAEKATISNQLKALAKTKSEMEAAIEKHKEFLRDATNDEEKKKLAKEISDWEKVVDDTTKEINKKSEKEAKLDDDIKKIEDNNKEKKDDKKKGDDKGKKDGDDGKDKDKK